MSNSKLFERNEGLYAKQLVCIAPQKAQSLGIPAEEPVLISPKVAGGTCNSCGETYTPLLYMQGRRMPSQHTPAVHKDASSGIYYYQTNKTRLRGLAREHGFVGIVEPDGEIFSIETGAGSFESIRRSAAVTLGEVWAGSDGQNNLLQEGVLVFTRGFNETGILRPVSFAESRRLDPSKLYAAFYKQADRLRFQPLGGYS